MKNLKSGQSYDGIIVGGGLSGQIIVHFLKQNFPKFNLLIIEKNDQLSHDHTWSFHEADVPEELREWFFSLASRVWDYYEVFFPLYSKKIDSKYYSIRAEDLAKKTILLDGVQIRYSTEVAKLFADRVELIGGEALFSPLVIDCRGWMQSQGPVAYQKFIGFDLRLKKPHGLSGVRLMDARVKQVDGFRFMYCLPWAEDRLLIEDTYYSLNPKLDFERIKVEIENYARAEGWEIESVERVESGALPLALQEHSYAKKMSQDGVPCLGAGSGFLHPVTGYSVPYLLFAISKLKGTEPRSISWNAQLIQTQRGRSLLLWYYRLLNRMLFWSADPEKRYIILQRFYLLPQGLISRYYGGRSSFFDCLRILMGKPPVKIRKALPMLILDK